MDATTKGFTIVELLIVIVVTAILAVTTIVAYNGVQSRAQVAAVQSALVQTSKKLALYTVDNNSYPAALSIIGINASTGTSFQYSVNNAVTPPTYCVTAANGTTAYMVSSTSTIPQSGVCPGHTDPGPVEALAVNGGVVTTLAGGTHGYLDGTGTAARFSYQQGVTVDSTNTVYVGDTGNNRIRKITSAGVVTTLAGSGSPSFADGTGTAAAFSHPMGVTVDSTGTVYVADNYNNRIRKITSAGVVTTLAGSGASSFVNGTGTAAAFYRPMDVTVNSTGIVYVADTDNNRIRKITSAGVVTTLAGSGSVGSVDGTGTAAAFNHPMGIAVDSTGTVYVADTNNNRIRKITSAGVVTSLAGSLTAGFVNNTGLSARFSAPQGVTVDSEGTVYIADTGNNRIRKITPAGVVTTLAGSGVASFANGTGTAAGLNHPMGITVNSMGVIYVGDNYNERIRAIN